MTQELFSAGWPTVTLPVGSGLTIPCRCRPQRCPFIPPRQAHPPHTVVSFSSLLSSSSYFADASPPPQAKDGDGSGNLRATLARYAFPSSTRKLLRSVVQPGVVVRGPITNAWCAHCEHARTIA